MAFEAAFTSESSVIHIYAFQSPVNETFINSEILKLEVNAEGYSELLRFIHKSFVRTANGEAKNVGIGLHGEKVSRFYLSNGEFHLFNTCNTWIAEALQSAKLDISSQESLQRIISWKKSENYLKYRLKTCFSSFLRVSMRLQFFY